MNCLRCRAQLTTVVCEVCGFDYSAASIMLLAEPPEDILRISCMNNIESMPSDIVDAAEQYKYAIEEFQIGDYDLAIRWLQTPAKKGNHNAQFLLGQIHEMDGRYHDQERAFYWYEQSAARGNKNAINRLIKHYETAVPANRLEKDRFAERLKRWRTKLQKIVQSEEKQKQKQIEQTNQGNVSTQSKKASVQRTSGGFQSKQNTVSGQEISTYPQYRKALENYFLDTFANSQPKALSRSQIEYFIYTNNLHAGFGITVDEVVTDLQAIYDKYGVARQTRLPPAVKEDPYKSKYITSYKVYFNTLTSLYLKRAKRPFSEAEILAFIREHDLDRRFGIRIDDVKTDLETIKKQYG